MYFRIRNPGRYFKVWNGTDSYGRAVESGNYFFQIINEDFVQAEKKILLK
jgi:hypothetical protein